MKNSSYTPDRPQITEVTCLNCQKTAQMKVYLLQVPNEEPSVITSYHCTHCGLKQNDLLDQYDDLNEKVIIQCKFTNREDIMREVNLPAFSRVKLLKSGQEFEYSTGKATVMPVEGIIRKVRDDLMGIFDIKSKEETRDDKARSDATPSSGIKSKEETSDSKARSDATSSSDIFTTTSSVGMKDEVSSIHSIGDRDQAEKQVEFLNEMIRVPEFEMIIEDDTGQARVAPIGVNVTDVKGKGIQEFYDDKVTTNFKRKCA